MKKHLPLYFFFLAGSALLWMSSSGGRAAAAGAGNTGAPGDDVPTCVTCHSGSSIEVDLNVSILDEEGNAIETYVPGQVYKARVEVEHTAGPEPAAYGFQMVALNDMTEEDIATFVNPDDNTQVAVASNTGRQYAEHAGPNRNTNFFEVDWMAPDAGSGSVTFYVGGNGVNGNGSNGGDGAALTSVTLMEDMTMATRDENLVPLQVYPNPVQDRLRVDAPSQVRSWTISTLEGRVIRQDIGTPTTIETQSLKSGLYLLRMEMEDGTFGVEKIIKTQ